MKEKKLSVSNCISILIIVGLLFACFKIYGYVDVYKDEIKALKMELTERTQMDDIKILTNEFIETSSIGQHKSFLTGVALEEYETALANRGFNEDHHHEDNDTLEKVELVNVFVEKTEKGKANSYAVYKAYFENNPNSDGINTQRILFLSLTANWTKEKNEYKVYEYKIDLLHDSLDDLLKNMSLESNEG